MAFLGGLVGKILAIVLLLLVLLVATVVYLYSTDYPVEATVTEKNCAMNPSTVTVKTKMAGLTDSVPVTSMECLVIQVGNFVEYHVRSQRTIIYEFEGGACVYDTQNRLC